RLIRVGAVPMSHGDDRPRAAFALLTWRVKLVVIAFLVVVSVLAWRSTIEQANAMSGMVMGLGHIGSKFQGGISAVALITMWVTMMAAMMLPTVAPMVLAHFAVTRERDGALPTVAFVGGYLVAWTAAGLLPLLAYWAFAQLGNEAAQSRWLPALAGAILVVAGVYQFTSWKRLCLDHCQSPFAFVVTHDFGGGVTGAFRAGAVHGTYCLGCCWAVMAGLVVLGVM